MEVEHRLVELTYKMGSCVCGWHRRLRTEDWGTKAAYDRLLDLYILHRRETGSWDAQVVSL